MPCPSRVGVRFWASLFLRKLANASGRIVFNIVLFMDWQFVSGCFPPRLSTTQLPSTTDSQCSVRWGLPPHCWCALSGARRKRNFARRAWPPVNSRRPFSDWSLVAHNWSTTFQAPARLIAQKGNRMLCDFRSCYGLAREFGQAGYFRARASAFLASPLLSRRWNGV